MAEPNTLTGLEQSDVLEVPRQPRALWTICLIQFGQSVTYAGIFSTLFEANNKAAFAAVDPSPAMTAVVLAGLATVPGGWIADRFIGARRAVLGGCVGMILAALGSVIPSEWVGIAALAALVIGNGLLSPNISVLLSRMYEGNDSRRYAGFACLQVGSLLGAVVGQAAGSAVVARFGVVAAIATTSIGALIAVTSYATGRRHLGALGSEAATGSVPTPRQQIRVVAAWLVAMVFIAAALFSTTIVAYVRVEDRWLEEADSLVSLGLVLAFFAWAAFSRRWSRLEANRVQAIGMIFGAMTLFSALRILFEEPGAARRMAPEPWESVLVSLDSFEGWVAAGAAAIAALVWQRRSVRPIPVSLVYACGLGLAAGGAVVTSLSTEWLFARPILISALLWILGSAVLVPVGTATVARMAPAGVAGTTIAIWDLSGSAAGSIWSLTGYPAQPNDAVGMAVAGLCLIAAVALFTQTRRLESMIEGPSSPPRPERSRLSKPAIYFAAVMAVVMVWTGVQAAGNRSTGRIIAAATPTFLPASANLPSDDMLGFIEVPESAYVIGAPDDDRLASRDERPRHTVRLAAFLVGKYEVTVAEYQQCVQEGGCVASDLRALDGPNNWPVRYVNWNEALAFCAWLEQKLASVDTPKPLSEALARLNTRSVSLPSEAEWEAAAQSAGSEPYPWAGMLAPSMANYAASGRLTPVPIGTFASGRSARGLMDVSGNVAEWTRSTYREYPFATDDRSNRDPRSDRVIRGGSFYDDVTLLRTTSRQVADPAIGYDFVGFRIVVGVDVMPDAVAAP